jgi:multidrug efflux pump subunit AcrB
MGAPFGFMAFLGIISLIGIIVSHVIVLFDFIEERHAEGDTLRDALIAAGILRVRPVLITVAATVLITWLGPHVAEVSAAPVGITPLAPAGT